MSLASTWPDLPTDDRRFRIVVEQISDVLLLADHSGRISYASPSLTRVLGHEPDEYVGSPVGELLSPSNPAECTRVFESCVDCPDAPRQYAGWWSHGDGTPRWIEASFTNLLEEPDVASVVVTVRDFTARKRREDALQSREREFRAFFEMAGVGTAEIDPGSGRFLRVNDKFCSMVGYTAEELLNLTPETLTHPDDFPHDWELWQKCLAENASEYCHEKRYVRKDGALVWVQVTTSVIRDEQGNPLCGAAIVRDVTDRRLAVESLQRSREELERRVEERTMELAAANQRVETLVAASPLSIISLSPDLIVRSWNPAAEQLFGWSEAEVLGKPLPIFPSEDRDRYEQEVRRLLTDPSLRHLETMSQHRGGALLNVSIWRAPLYDRQNNLQGSMAIIMDVTERIRLERALLDAGEREQRRIGQDLHDHLCQQLLGVACLLKGMALSADQGGQLHAVDLHQAAKLVNDTVQQTRDIARGLHPVELDAEGLMSALQSLAERVNCSVPCELDCKHPVLFNDRDAAMHCYRIAQEAVTNALKHARPNRIVIRLTEDSERVLLEIIDDGSGFDLQGTRGTGMGSDIMKYRAHAIGGRLVLETKRPGGTRVACSIPKPK